MGTWILYIVLSILVVTGLALLIEWIVRRVAGGKYSKAEEPGLEISNKRYTWAELGKEEYKEAIGDIDLRLMDYFLDTLK